ncbi:hypothetical protein K2173_015876 [Erythroxylum novogranatense]|uniref:Tubulin--tyrosine ligase-like protein 12 SET-like domain-containing protein n=1 Tax=Erythroxylum novogranatense TaxID=1862640 RepID=A0AAV8SF79_9ROSI|nr:hypothetical protein K2173_015876 [Erythroxylum novogranatense]
MSATGGRRVETYDDFVEVHGLLLTSSSLPSSLHRKLFEKLTTETFDGGAHFQVEPCEDGRQRRLLLTSNSMPKDSDVFLVDHAWTFRLSDAYKQLQEVPGLAQRMASLMCVDIDLPDAEEVDEHGVHEENGSKLKVMDVIENEIRNAQEKGSDTVKWLELEELDIDDDMLLSLDLCSKVPDLVALSLLGNKLKNADVVVQEVSKFKNLKALWLNDNPVLKTDAIFKECPRLEIFNSHFTHNYSLWALGFCGAFSPVELPFLSHLNIRGNPLEENTVAELFEVLNGFPSLQSLEVDIPGPLGESAIDILESLPKLSILNVHVIDSVLQPRLLEWTAEESLADRVINAMWLYVMTYRLADEEKLDETSVWYVMDELGSALRHSDMPNFRVAPFLFMPEGKLDTAVSYSILWPVQDVQYGEECTRDFLFGIGRSNNVLPDLLHFPYTKNYFIKEYEKLCLKLRSKSLTCLPAKSPSTRSLRRGDGHALRVYTDIPQVEEYLTRPEFVITNEPKDADIIWTSMQVDDEVKKVTGITEQQYINQFPFEACIVMKHHLADTIQKAHGSPDWLQPTYNLETHLSPLIGDYHVRERDGLNNLWILKPWNMARTIDTTVTHNLSAIIRLMETGPKICQKYIEHPALFQGRKFDLRFIVLVRSIDPLELFLADTFWVRLANNPYTLDEHSLFESKLISLSWCNYRGRLNHKTLQIKWLDIHQRIKNMIQSVFEAAAIVHPTMHSPTSRAMYGIDIMLDGSFQPKLLEVTYCPDCTRACKYDTEAIIGGGEVVKGVDFFNYVFGCLFLDETAHVSPL